MLGYEKLSLAYPLITQCLSDLLLVSEIDEDLNRIKMILKDNTIMYILYNDSDEYSYVIQFSLEKFDRVRFDNYDKLWDVNTNPHHCHPRFSHPAIESSFIGDPQVDMSLLCKIITNGSIYKQDGYFKL